MINPWQNTRSCMPGEDRSSGAGIFITAFYAWAAITWNCSHETRPLFTHPANVYNLLVSSQEGRQFEIHLCCMFTDKINPNWCRCIVYALFGTWLRLFTWMTLRFVLISGKLFSAPCCGLKRENYTLFQGWGRPQRLQKPPRFTFPPFPPARESFPFSRTRVPIPPGESGLKIASPKILSFSTGTTSVLHFCS